VPPLSAYRASSPLLTFVAARTLASPMASATLSSIASITRRLVTPARGVRPHPGCLSYCQQPGRRTRTESRALLPQRSPPHLLDPETSVDSRLLASRRRSDYPFQERQRRCLSFGSWWCSRLRGAAIFQKADYTSPAQRNGGERFADSRTDPNVTRPFVESLRALIAAPPACDVIFTAQ
jgi:hypothetical protein